MTCIVRMRDLSWPSCKRDAWKFDENGKHGKKVGERKQDVKIWKYEVRLILIFLNNILYRHSHRHFVYSLRIEILSFDSLFLCLEHTHTPDTHTHMK
jgi:hypothetical protein